MEQIAANFADLFNPSLAVTNFASLFQVILIDLALAGDNAVAVGLAASSLAKHQQRTAIFWGIVMALVLRVIFATVTVQLLSIQGLLLAGGLLLFWVAYRMWSDLKHHQPVMVGDPAVPHGKPPKTFASAIFTIIVADVSMSLDNVLAVAAVSRHNEVIMWFGLVLSVILMGVAASIIAKVINKYQWIAVVGIIIIVIAGVRMVWEDGHNFYPSQIPPIPAFMGGHHS